MSAEAEGPMAWVPPPPVDNSRAVQALLIVLSVTAGCTDIIGFLVLNGLFTAHITGNLVILAAHIVGGGEAQIAPMLSVPVFIVMVGLTRLGVGGLESIGLASLRPLLLLQFLLLAGFLVLCVAASTRTRQMRSSRACSASRRWPCRTHSCRSRLKEHRPRR